MFQSKIMRKLLFLVLGLVTVYTAVTVFIAMPKIEESIRSLEEKNANLVLEKIVVLTENTGKNLQSYRKLALQQHKQELKELMSVVVTMLRHTDEVFTLENNASGCYKEQFLKLIEQIRYDGENYFFAFDYNASMLAHPFIAKGSDMRHVKDIFGKPIAPTLIDVARKKGAGFTRYWWQRNGKDTTPREKLSYSYDFKPWKMVIATGVYLDDISQEVKRRKQQLYSQLREIVRHTRIGENGYTFIFDDNMIMHPNNNVNSENFKKLLNPGKGTYIIDDLKTAAHTTGRLYYKWDKPNDKGHFVYDKIAWVKYIPSMDIYAVSSVYVDDIVCTARTIRNQLLLIGLLVLVLSLLFGALMLRYLLKPMETLTRVAGEIAQGDYTKRAQLNSNDEIEELAKYFNMMVDRLELQIKTLDQQVKEKTKELEVLAVTDPLTKLYNRRYFTEISNEMFAMAKRQREPLSIVMFDIDHFKNINDTYGHLVGDRVIGRFANIIRNVKRQSDIACRFGGEEFILLLPKTGIEGAKELAERIRIYAESEEITVEDGRSVTFTVSVGVSECDFERDDSIEAVIRRSDDAMYTAKKSGRNRTDIL